MGGEKLWKILCQPVKNFRILAIFSSFIAYETVDEFVTSCEKPVASQPSLLVRDETMKRSFLVSLPSTTFTMLKRGLDPLLPSLLSYLRTSTIFYKNVEHFSLFLMMLIKQGNWDLLYRGFSLLKVFQTSGYVLHQKIGTWNWVKAQKNVANLILLLW